MDPNLSTIFPQKCRIFCYWTCLWHHPSTARHWKCLTKIRGKHWSQSSKTSSQLIKHSWKHGGKPSQSNDTKKSRYLKEATMIFRPFFSNQKCISLRLHGMSWGVKTTCFKAPGVSIGGSGVSIGGVRSLRDPSSLAQFRLINVAIDASDLHFASISWHIKPAQLSALFESIKDLQTLFALNFWHQKQNVSLHVLWKNRHLKNKNKQNLT